MSTSNIIPVYDPSGTLRDVPYEQLVDAVKNGGVPAHPVQDPTGKTRFVPVTRLSEAVAHGGTILNPSTPDADLPSLYGFTLKNLGSNIWEGAKSTVTGAYGLGKDLMQNPNWVEGDQSTLHKFVEKPMLDQSQKAAQSFSEGRNVEGVGHTIASGLPFLGPWAASLGEQAGTGDIGGAAAKGAGQVATPFLAGKAVSAVGKVVPPFLRTASERIYQSALKPSTTIAPGKVRGMVQTGLQEGIPVSAGGVDKLSGLIDDVNTNIAQTIGSGSGKTVNPFAVASRLSNTAQRFQTQVNPEADLNAISDAGNEFLRNNPDPIPAEDAQAMKTGTYQQLRGKAYGELKSSAIESQKALARGIKEELNSQFPELSNLNAQDSSLLNLQSALERAVQRQGNHQLIGISTPIAGIAGRALTGSAKLGAVAAAVKAIVDMPAVKSSLAIALNRAGSPRPIANVRLNAYSSALAGAAAASADAGGDGNGR